MQKKITNKWITKKKCCCKNVKSLILQNISHQDITHIGSLHIPVMLSDERILAWFDMTLTQKLGSKSLHILYPKALRGPIWANMGQGERRYTPGKLYWTDRRMDDRIKDRLINIGHHRTRALIMIPGDRMGPQWGLNFYIQVNRELFFEIFSKIN